MEGFNMIEVVHYKAGLAKHRNCFNSKKLEY